MSKYLKTEHQKDFNPNLLSKDEMWNSINKTSEIKGIDGYYPSVVHFDAKKNKFSRETLELNLNVWSGKALYPPPNLPKDENGKIILPKKKNFIDDEVKRSNSYFSPEKAEKYAESKGLIPYDKKLKEGNAKSYIYAHDRETYINKLYKQKKFETQLNEQQQEKADKVKEKHAEMMKTKPHWFEIMKKNYSEGGKDKKRISSDRIGVSSDQQYLSEKIPFWTSKPKNEDDKDKKDFYPKIDYTISLNPVVKIHKPHVLNTEYLDKREEILNEKNEKVKTKWEEKKIKFLGNSNENFNIIKNRGKLVMIFKDVFF